MPLGLTRKVGESIIIDGDIKITVAQLSNGQVRLYITAPRDTPILRDEFLKEGNKFYDDEFVAAHREKLEKKRIKR